MTVRGAKTLDDVIALARLVAFQITVPSDADLDWPVHDLAETKITLYQLLMEVCREHNLTINYTPSGLELRRTPMSFQGNFQTSATLPALCKARQYCGLRIRSRCLILRFSRR